MQLLDHVDILLLQLFLADLTALFVVGTKPTVEQLARIEDVWQDEVEQTPQFVQVILQWGSRQQQLEVRR